MVYRTQDRGARRDFWRRVVGFHRISTPWYLLIFFIFPVVLAIGFLLYSVLGNPLPEFETLAQIASNPASLMGLVIIGIVGGALSEELGWRGFAMDMLHDRWPPLKSSLLIAPFWFGWHLPLFFMEGTTQSAWGIGTLSFWLFVVTIVPLSILFTWAYAQNRRSILAPILLHFAYNFTLSLVYPLPRTVNLLHTTGLLIAAAAVVLFADSRP